MKILLEKSIHCLLYACILIGVVSCAPKKSVETLPGVTQGEQMRDAQGAESFAASFEDDSLEGEDTSACYVMEAPSPVARRDRGKKGRRVWSTDEERGVPLQKGQGKTRLIGVARTALGTPYVRGGTSRQGFDCSGFVQWSYRHVGIKLPRTAAEQARVGQRVSHKDMQPGDIVTFHHPKRGYHSGIYVGDGKFIHSPRTGSSVRINSLDDPYFSKNFLSARRVKHVSSVDIADAEQLLANYDDRKYNRPVVRTRASRSATRRMSRSARKQERGPRDSYVVTSSRKKGVRPSGKANRTVQKAQASASPQQPQKAAAAQKKQQVTAQNSVKKSRKPDVGRKEAKDLVRKRESTPVKQQTANRKLDSRKTGRPNKNSRSEVKQSMRS